MTPFADRHLVHRLSRPDARAMQGAVRAVIAQRRLQVLLEQIQAGKLEPKSLIHTPDDGIRCAGTAFTPVS